MFAEDMSVFFDTERGFAIAATCTVGGGAAVAGSVIFDEPGDEFGEVVTTVPAVQIPASQWIGVGEEDVLTLDAGDLPPQLLHLAGSYKVRQSALQGDGAMRLLTLARA